MSVTIEQDLKEILNQISEKLGNLQKDVTDLKIGQARLEEKVEGIDKELTSLKEGINKETTSLKDDLKELKGSQKAQIWTLIGILGTALMGTVIRYIIIPFPHQ